MAAQSGAGARGGAAKEGGGVAATGGGGAPKEGGGTPNGIVVAGPGFKACGAPDGGATPHDDAAGGGGAPVERRPSGPVIEGACANTSCVSTTVGSLIRAGIGATGTCVGATAMRAPGGGIGAGFRAGAGARAGALTGVAARSGARRRSISAPPIAAVSASSWGRVPSS